MIKLSDQQENAYNLIKDFAADKSTPVFILKGYAGTGKTTMIKAILPMLQSMGKTVMLMAPTGRAAKVLSDKTGYPATTIHKAIYELSHLSEARHNQEGEKMNSALAQSSRARGVDDLEFYFGLRLRLPNGISPDRLVCIVDESSMISSHKNTGEVMHFGTDVLLDDLFSFGNPNKGAKFIFVGDPAQLPPVGDSSSAALDETYFAANGVKTMGCELTEVLRQESGSAILSNATRIRELLGQSERSELAFERVAGEVDDITPHEVTRSFTDSYPRPQMGSSVVICYSNAAVREYNQSIREQYFDSTDTPQVGDVVQVVRNNQGLDLYNGDFAQFVSVSDYVETQSAPVWTTAGAQRKRVNVELRFRDVCLLTYDGRTIDCKIVETLLNNPNPGLMPIETTALYISFRIRHPELKTKEEISMGLQHDPYFNALCVKYGYAITCHKAQGGEWATVYVDYHGRTGLDNDSLRWSYTATTRAAKHLYGVLMPNVQLLDRLQVNAVIKTTKPAKGALAVKPCGDIAGLPASATSSQKAKFLSAQTALAPMGCSVAKVELNNYVDRYHVVTPTGEHTYDLQYNGAGIYVSVKPLGTSADDGAVANALMSNSEYIYDVQYSPQATSLSKLYAFMQSACDELDIAITNITEAQYQVTYHLKTSGLFSSIAFFYNNKKAITYAAPMSDMGSDDGKLNLLIEKLKQ